MAVPKNRASVARSVKEHRARLREQGLRPVQFWLPDLGRADIARAALRQSRAVATSAQEAVDLDFVESVSLLLEPE